MDDGRFVCIRGIGGNHIMAWNQQDEERYIKGFADGDDDALDIAFDIIQRGVWNVDKNSDKYGKCILIRLTVSNLGICF